MTMVENNHSILIVNGLVIKSAAYFGLKKQGHITTEQQ